MKFLILLALGWLNPPQDPLFRVHCSTRQVTCLAEGAIGTSGGLRRPGAHPVEMPGVAVRAIHGGTVASEAGIFEEGRCLDARPAWSLTRTPQGLVSGHNAGRVKFWSTGEELQCPSDAPIHSLIWDGQQVWAASNQGLWRLAPAGPEEVRLSSNPIASTVTCVVAYPNGILVGTAAGAYRRKGGDWAALPGGVVNVSALAVGEDGHAWVGTPDRGLYEEGEGGLQPVQPDCKGVTALLWTRQGVMVGTDHGAFLGGKPLYDHADEISGNHVTALACSKGSVWVGTFQDGLAQKQNGRSWAPVQGLPSTWVNQLSTSGEQVLVRFSSGLVLSGQNLGASTRWQTMGRSCGWPKDWTSGLGQGWVTTLSGFYAQQGKGWKTFTPKPALQGVTVTGVARYQKQYWLASQNGVYAYQPESGQCRQFVGELPDSWVTCLETYQGQLWAGTFRGGLCRFDGSSWVQVSEAGERIHCLLATSAGLWIGTPKGLVWTDGQRWRRFGRDQGLPSEAVWSLATRGDELWAGTDSGLCESRLSQLVSPFKI